MERSIHFRPAFDRRDPDPRKDCGIHGVEIVFRLTHEGEGITWTIFTNWQLPHIQAETDAQPLNAIPYMFHKPIPAGLDGHWKTPRYEGQQSIRPCAITGGECYSDGTSLTDGLFNILLEEGEEAVWKYMEDRFLAWSKT